MTSISLSFRTKCNIIDCLGLQVVNVRLYDAAEPDASEPAL